MSSFLDEDSSLLLVNSIVISVTGITENLESWKSRIDKKMGEGKRRVVIANGGAYKFYKEVEEVK